MHLGDIEEVASAVDWEAVRRGVVCIRAPCAAPEPLYTTMPVPTPTHAAGSAPLSEVIAGGGRDRPGAPITGIAAVLAAVAAAAWLLRRTA